MPDMYWVVATATLPDDLPIEVWQPGKFHEACCTAAGIDPPRPVNDLTDDEDERYTEASDRLAPLTRFLEADEAQLNDRTICLAGSYSYGLIGFADTIGFEATCRSFGIPFIASDDGGQCETGTWTSWQPIGGPEGVNLTLPADQDNQPVVDRGVWANLAKLSDAEIVRALSVIFADTPDLSEYPA